jgi:signal transduction histidine kinase
LSDFEFKIIYANKAARKIRQYEGSEDLAQKGFLDYLPAGGRAYFTENIFPVAFVQGVWRGEAVWIGKDQKQIPVSQVMIIEKPSNGKSGFIASIARDVSDTKEKESEIKKMNEQLRDLAASLQNIREEERSSIAREIHDDLGQQLTAIKIDVSWIAKKIQSADYEVRNKLNGIIPMINEAVKFIRKISTQLRPGILDDLGLIEALKWQTEEFRKRYEIAVDFVCNKDRLILDQRIATGLFRIFQEALTNIARHANATLVKISLSIIGKELVLCIQDNGRGFEMHEVQAQKALGLFGMKERILMMGGHLEIRSASGEGVMLAINVLINNQE